MLQNVRLQIAFRRTSHESGASLFVSEGQGLLGAVSTESVLEAIGYQTLKICEPMAMMHEERHTIVTPTVDSRSMRTSTDTESRKRWTAKGLASEVEGVFLGQVKLQSL